MSRSTRRRRRKTTPINSSSSNASSNLAAAALFQQNIATSLNLQPPHCKTTQTQQQQLQQQVGLLLRRREQDQKNHSIDLQQRTSSPIQTRQNDNNDVHYDRHGRHWVCQQCTLLNEGKDERCRVCNGRQNSEQNRNLWDSDDCIAEKASIGGCVDTLAPAEWKSKEDEALKRINDTCIICHDNYGKMDDQVILSCCSRVFHRVCLSDYELSTTAAAAADASTTAPASRTFSTFHTCPVCRTSNYSKKQTTIGTLSNLTNIVTKINALVRGWLQRKKFDSYLLTFLAPSAPRNVAINDDTSDYCQSTTKREKDSIIAKRIWHRRNKERHKMKREKVISQICHRVDTHEDYVDDLMDTFDKTILHCRNTMAAVLLFNVKEGENNKNNQR